MVGITLGPDTWPPKLLFAFRAKAAKFKSYLHRYTLSYLLGIRSLQAYVSKLDYVARGSSLPGLLLSDLQPSVKSVWRVLLCLPQDTPTAALRTPITAAGWGAPNLEVCEQVNFLHGYCAP